MNNKSEKNLWPTGLTIALIISASFTLAMVTLALKHSPELISKTYYQDGYNLKEVIANRSTSQLTGWKVSVIPHSNRLADMPLLQIEVLSENGQPCDSLSGEVSLYRPSRQALDIAASSIKPLGMGKYFIRLPREIERGAWQALVNLSKDRLIYSERVNFFVDG